MSISEDQKKEYQKYVKEITPTHSLPLEMGKAFLTGGIICLLGQLLQNDLSRKQPEPGAPFFWFLSVSCSRDSVSIRSLPNGAVPAPWFPSPVLPTALLLPLSNTKRKGRSSASVPKSSPLPVLSSCTVCLLPGFWDSSTGSSASCNPDRVLL